MTWKTGRQEHSVYKIITITSWTRQITETFITSIKHTTTNGYWVKDTSGKDQLNHEQLFIHTSRCLIAQEWSGHRAQPWKDIQKQVTYSEQKGHKKTHNAVCFSYQVERTPKDIIPNQHISSECVSKMSDRTATFNRWSTKHEMKQSYCPWRLGNLMHCVLSGLNFRELTTPKHSQIPDIILNTEEQVRSSV